MFVVDSVVGLVVLEGPCGRVACGWALGYEQSTLTHSLTPFLLPLSINREMEDYKNGWREKTKIIDENKMLSENRKDDNEGDGELWRWSDWSQTWSE